MINGSVLLVEGMKRQLALILQKSLSLGILPKIQSGERRVFHGKENLDEQSCPSFADTQKSTPFTSPWVYHREV